MEMAVPGHTHNDADAVFGNFSKMMKLQDIFIPEDIFQQFIRAVDAHAAEAAKASYRASKLGVTGKAECVFLESVPDFKAFYGWKEVMACHL